MSKKNISIKLLIKLFIILVLTFIVVISYKQTNSSSPYYKSPDAQVNSLTSITHKEKLKEQKSILLAKKKISATFTASSNNLGIIAIPFDTHKRSIEDKLIFRLKQTGDKNWYYTGTYNTDQIQHLIPFPFGFPVIHNANNHSYTFELESISGTKNNSLSLPDKDSYALSKYKFNKSDLANPLILMQFIIAKIIEQINSLTITEIIIILLTPFSVFLLKPIQNISTKIDKKINDFFIRNKINHKNIILKPIQNISTKKIDKKINKLFIRNKINREYIMRQLMQNLMQTYSFCKEIPKRFSLFLKNSPITNGLDKNQKIRLCSLIVGVGFFFAVFYHYLQAVLYKQLYPFSSPLPSGFFGDFALYISWRAQHFNGIDYAFSYFPGMYLSIELMSSIFDTHFFEATMTMIAALTITLFLYTYNSIKTKSKLETLSNAFIISIMSYPFLFTAQTTNTEIFTFIFICLFFIFYKRNKLLSNLSLAYAISTKLFPGILLILLLVEKKYKDLLLTCLFAAFFTILPLMIFDGGFNKGIDNYYSHLKASQEMYSNLMIMSGAGNHYGHSLLNGLRAYIGPTFPPMEQVIFPYIIFAVICIILLTIYLKFFEKIFWRKATCLILAMDLLPFTSTDYKLLYIFLPLFLLINHKEKNKYDALFIVLLSSLLITKNYIYFHGNPLLSLNVVMNPAVMIIIIMIIIITGLRTSLRGADTKATKQSPT